VSREKALRWVLLLAALAALLLHARVYAFLCDDAFISFRYAKNLAEGHGLVFNPGFERVEGYTNFLWVLILAAGDRLLGMKPEELANPLLVLATVGLFALVARRAQGEREEGEAWWPALVPLVLLAATRSVAVWTTSGLETRLFELLVVAATLRLVRETGAIADAHRTLVPWSGLLFALATLTRPDGLLMAGCAIGVAALLTLGAWRKTWKHRLLQGVLFAVPVTLHFVWRYAYYGAWLPNTYYAKVGGRTWWEMGGAYLASFALEYFVVLWVPFVVLAVARHARRATLGIPLVYAAVVVPHALYVARIGGDHFEYRPLDLYFPFLYLLIGDGMREAAARWGAVASLPRKIPTVGLAGLVLLGVCWIPWRSHREFPKEFIPGFPGMRTGRTLASAYLDPADDPLLRSPGLRAVATAHRDLLRTTTSRLVGTRAEEHRLFLGTAIRTGRKLRELVDRGVLPADTHIAISAVGVIPYLSGLRTLDRLGLTDPVVARMPPNELRILAHDRHATIDYAARIGVDLWAEDPVHPWLALDDSRLGYVLDDARKAERDVHFAEIDGGVILARFPNGEVRGKQRFPKLTFHSTLRNAEAVAALRRAAAAAERAQLATRPDSLEARVVAALSLAEEGDLDGAVRSLEGLDRPDDPNVLFNLGTLYARQGRYEEAVTALRTAVATVPDFPGGRFNLGLALGRLGRWEEARVELAAAVDLDPTDPTPLYAFGAACLVLGDDAGRVRAAERLRRLGSASAVELAERLERGTP
jgi:hypothetical protein